MKTAKTMLFSLEILCLLAILIDLVSDKNKSNVKYVFLALLPFVIPDFIFSSLIVNSTNISFVLALLSTILYVKFLKKNNYWIFGFSILFMALSIPFRWSNLVYYPVFLSFLIYVSNFDKILIFKQLKSLALFYATSLILGIFFIYISGYDFKTLINTIIWGKQYMDNSEKSLVSTVAIASSFFTIPLLVVLFFGIIIFLKQNRKQIFWRILFVVLPFIPYFILGLFIAYKYAITIVPLIIIIGLAGFIEVNKNKFLKFSFYLSLIGIWFVGIKINVDNTLYGSGYEFKKLVVRQSQPINEKNLDARLKFNAILPTFDGGFYIPTPEGPRPLFGYFYVIFGGLWKNDIDNLAKNRALVVEKLMLNKKTILLQDRKTAYLECDLYKFGYKTNAPFKLNVSKNLEIRTYVKNNDTILVNAISDGVSKADFSVDFIKNNENVIFRSSYSSLIYNILTKKTDAKMLDAYTVYKHSE